MKIHLRFDSHNEQHAHMTLFINGQNNGTLCTSPAEAIWLHHVLAKGAEALTLPNDKAPFVFISSGKCPQPSGQQIDTALRSIVPPL